MSSPSSVPQQQLLDLAYDGAIMASILYGFFVYLALSNIYKLVQRRYYKLALFTAFVLAITTLYDAVGINYTQKIVIDAPSNAGFELSWWPQVVQDATYVVNTWLTDGYLLYRCFIVWSGPYQMLIMILPGLLFLGTLACSMAFLIFAGNPGATYISTLVQAFGTANWSTSLALNVVLTILIAARLIYFRRRIQRVLGPRHGSVYGEILAISVECSLLYAIFAIFILVFFVTNSNLEDVFFPIQGHIQVIAPSLIIQRVANGSSFDTTEGTTTEGSRTLDTHINFATSARPSAGESNTRIEEETSLNSRDIPMKFAKAESKV